MTKNNIFSDIPSCIDQKVFEALVSRDNIRIERIISHGQASPETGWYDQAENEWVIVLSGSASLLLEGDSEMELKAGNYVFIHAHRRHKVLKTDSGQPTVWLAIFFE